MPDISPRVLHMHQDVHPRQIAPPRQRLVEYPTSPKKVVESIVAFALPEMVEFGEIPTETAQTGRWHCSPNECPPHLESQNAQVKCTTSVLVMVLLRCLSHPATVHPALSTSQAQLHRHQTADHLQVAYVFHHRLIESSESVNFHRAYQEQSPDRQCHHATQLPEHQDAVALVGHQHRDNRNNLLARSATPVF